MPIPDYQSLMAPVVHALADGQERTKRELLDRVIAGVGLTDAELREQIRVPLTPAGAARRERSPT